MSDLEKAGSPRSPQRPRMSRIEYLRHANELDRQKNPHLYLGMGSPGHDKWLYLQNVAWMLGTTKDYVYRLSREELPVARIGRRIVYDRNHVDAFIAMRMEKSAKHYLAERQPRAVSSKNAAVAALDAKPFDPLATIRKLKGGK